MPSTTFRLTAAQLKWLALITMVIDHTAYFFSLPVWLRWIGRLAAPIFLFLVVEGFCHTHNLKKYLLRMYAVAASMGIINILLAHFGNCLRADGVTPTNSICSTFFLLLVILTGVRLCERQNYLPGLIVIASPIAVTLLLHSLLPFRPAKMLLSTVLPSPFYSEGGLQLLCLGVLLYLFRANRKTQFFVFACYSVACNILLYLGVGSISFFFTTGFQWMELFALLPLWFYSGERGRCPRWFFYVFYPAHIYLLWFLSTLVF